MLQKSCKKKKYHGHMSTHSGQFRRGPHFHLVGFKLAAFLGDQLNRMQSIMKPAHYVAGQATS